MQKKITLDMLNVRSVSIKTQKYIEQDGTEYQIGQPHRKAYVNSIRGRQELQNELTEPYKSAVLAVWGNEPTVNENVED